MKSLRSHVTLFQADDQPPASGAALEVLMNSRFLISYCTCPFWDILSIFEPWFDHFVTCIYLWWAIQNPGVGLSTVLEQPESIRGADVHFAIFCSCHFWSLYNNVVCLHVIGSNIIILWWSRLLALWTCSTLRSFQILPYSHLLYCIISYYITHWPLCLASLCVCVRA